MRQIQSRSQSSWPHYVKAAAIFTLTTATLTMSSTEEGYDGFQLQFSVLTDLQIAESTDLTIIKEGGDQSQTPSTQRHLLQLQNQVTLNKPIPDQTIQVDQQYIYSLDGVFNGDYALIQAVETGQNGMPS